MTLPLALIEAKGLTCTGAPSPGAATRNHRTRLGSGAIPNASNTIAGRCPCRGADQLSPGNAQPWPLHLVSPAARRVGTKVPSLRLRVLDRHSPGVRPVRSGAALSCPRCRGDRRDGVAGRRWYRPASAGPRRELRLALLGLHYTVVGERLRSHSATDCGVELRDAEGASHARR